MLLIKNFKKFRKMHSQTSIERAMNIWNFNNPYHQIIWHPNYVLFINYQICWLR